MKADKNAAGAEKRSAKAFYPELAEGRGAFDLLHLLRKAEPVAPQPDDLTTTTGVRRGKSKGGTLSKRREKPHSHPEQNLDLPLLASLKKVGCWKIFQVSPALAIALNFRRKGVTRYKFERLGTHSSRAERVGRSRGTFGLEV